MSDRKLHSALGLVGVLAADLLVTAVLIAFREDVPSVVPFGLMLGICVATRWGSSVWSGVYAGHGRALYDFFFTEPYGKVYIANVAERARRGAPGRRGAVCRPRPRGPDVPRQSARTRRQDVAHLRCGWLRVGGRPLPVESRWSLYPLPGGVRLHGFWVAQVGSRWRTDGEGSTDLRVTPNYRAPTS
jgi:hypothetical protein